MIMKNKTYCKVTGKLCYSSNEASRVINQAHKRKAENIRSHLGKYVPTRMYYCNCCQHFHLTSNKNPNIKPRRKQYAKKMRKVS